MHDGQGPQETSEAAECPASLGVVEIGGHLRESLILLGGGVHRMHGFTDGRGGSGLRAVSGENKINIKFDARKRRTAAGCV